MSPASGAFVYVGSLVQRLLTIKPNVCYPAHARSYTPQKYPHYTEAPAFYPFAVIAGCFVQNCHPANFGLVVFATQKLPLKH
jgi:hypothetical protein